MPVSTSRARPRVEGDRESEILDATVTLLLEHGYDRLTMDAVARKAKASKATLYRRWESKPALVADALVRLKGQPAPEPVDTGSLRGDLVTAFCGRGGIRDSRLHEVVASVITAISTDPEFGDLFRNTFIAPKVAALRAIYERAIERGEIPRTTDLEVIVPALAGVILHRTYVLGERPDDALITRIIDHLILPAVGLDCGDLTTPSRKKTRP